MTEIRSNQQLENDLNLMDIKIGLLVRNRITLQVLKNCAVQICALINVKSVNQSLDEFLAFHATGIENMVQYNFVH